MQDMQYQWYMRFCEMWRNNHCGPNGEVILVKCLAATLIASRRANFGTNQYPPVDSSQSGYFVLLPHLCRSPSAMAERKATISRKTNETEIEVSINLDTQPGSGLQQVIEISTGIGFLDHVRPIKLSIHRPLTTHIRFEHTLFSLIRCIMLSLNILGSRSL